MFQAGALSGRAKAGDFGPSRAGAALEARSEEPPKPQRLIVER